MRRAAWEIPKTESRLLGLAGSAHSPLDDTHQECFLLHKLDQERRVRGRHEARDNHGAPQERDLRRAVVRPAGLPESSAMAY